MRNHDIAGFHDAASSKIISKSCLSPEYISAPWTSIDRPRTMSGRAGGWLSMGHSASDRARAQIGWNRTPDRLPGGDGIEGGCHANFTGVFISGPAGSCPGVPFDLGGGMDTLEFQDRRLPAMARARAATLAAAKRRLIRCTVPGSTPNRLAMTRTPGLPGVARASRIRFFQGGGYRRPPEAV